MRHFKLILLLFLLAFPIAAYGQEPTPDAAPDATPEATAGTAELDTVIIDALQALDTENYHFVVDSTVNYTLSSADEYVSSTYAHYLHEGDVDASGNSSNRLSVISGISPDVVEGMQPLVIDRVMLDGETYVNFHTDGTIYEHQFAVADGWWRADDLLAQFDSEPMHYAISNLVDFPLPSILRFPVDNILSVTPAGSDEIDGTDVQVYNVELNGLAVLMDNTPGNALEQAGQFLQNLDTISKADLSATFRLWIGEDDGRVYRGIFKSHQFLPYLSAGSASDFPYDVLSDSGTTFTVTYLDSAPEIAAPPSADLND